MNTFWKTKTWVFSLTIYFSGKPRQIFSLLVQRSVIANAFTRLPTLTYWWDFTGEGSSSDISVSVSKSLPPNPKLHGSYCTYSPTHGLPPLLGTGSVRIRVRFLTPAHASAKHSVQVPHTLQLPCCTPHISHASLPSHPKLTSTAKYRKYHFPQTQVKNKLTK